MKKIFPAIILAVLMVFAFGANCYAAPVDESASSLASYEDDVIRLVNAERAKLKLPALKKDSKLMEVARLKSKDMVDKKYFSHNSPTYGSPSQMLKSRGIGFTAMAENIAKGQRTPSEVVRAWMSSPGHRANILSQRVTNIGVGAVRDPRNGIVWTQVFTRPR